MHLSSEEVTVRAGHKVLMEVDDNGGVIVGDPRGIVREQLRPYSIMFFYWRAFCQKAELEVLWLGVRLG